MLKTFACLFLDFSVDNTFKCVHMKLQQMMKLVARRQ